MLNVLHTQLYRLKKSKLFWALFIVCAVLPLLGSLLVRGGVSLIFGLLDGDVEDLNSAFQSEGGILTLSLLGGQISLSSNAALFSLICSSIFLSGEFSGGAIRNMVLANKSRTQIFFSFLSTALIIGCSYFGASYVSTVACYGIMMGFGGVTAGQALSGCFTTLFLALISIAVVQSCVCFFLFTTRKTGPTVAFPLLLVIFVPSLITTVVEIVVALNAFAGEQISEVVISWIPFTNMNLFSAAHVDGALVGKIAMYNIPIAALFGVFGWLASKKDMK